MRNVINALTTAGVLILPSISLGQTATTSQQSEFYLEKNLVNRVYDQTVSEETTSNSNNSTMSPQVGLLVPSSFVIQNDYFTVDYAEELGSLPFISLGLTKEIYSVGQFGFLSKGEVGYSYREGSYSASSSSGGQVEDTITLQWLPVSLSLSGEYRPQWARWLKASLDILGGAHWVHHSGTIDGLDHSSWLPAYGAGSTLTFFSSTPGDTQFFGGLVLGANYVKSTDSEQKLAGWQYKLGSTIIL